MRPPGAAARVPKRIWIGGLPHNVKANLLQAEFEHCGKVEDTQVRHGKTDTFAFMTFADESGYDEAMATMDGAQILGSRIKVNFVLKDPKGSGKGDRGRSRSPAWQERGGSSGGRGRWENNYKERKDSRGRGRGVDRDRGNNGWQERGDWDGHRRNSYVVRDVRDDVRHDRGRGSGCSRSRGDGDRRDRERGTSWKGGYQERDNRGSGNWEGGRGNGRGGGGGAGGGSWDWRRRDGDRWQREDWRGGRGDSGREYTASGGQAATTAASGARDGASGDAELRHENRIWVGGLPKDITERELNATFSKLGPVYDVCICHSERDTFAFMYYLSRDLADRAIQEFNQSQVFGGPMKVARPRPRRDDDAAHMKEAPPARQQGGRSRSLVSPRERRGGRKYRVVIGNLPDDMSKDEFLEMVEAYGQVLTSKLWEDRETGSDRGGAVCQAGLAEYASSEEANDAVHELNDRRMEDWDLRLTAHIDRGAAR